MSSDLYTAFIEHCGPVFLCCKPASLFPLDASQDYLEQYARQLSRFGIRMKVLRRCGSRVLFFAYRPVLLQRAINHPDTKKALADFGYPLEGGLDGILDKLQGRIGEQGTFPHEIGFFLGYPPADVIGFIRNKGAGYKYCGLWKVYDDVEEACKLFSLYDSCRHFMRQNARLYPDFERFINASTAGQPA